MGRPLPSNRTLVEPMKFLLLGRRLNNYLDKLGSYHCELMSGDLLKPMSKVKTPFSFFNT
jgi:hypothetical protein